MGSVKSEGGGGGVGRSYPEAGWDFAGTEGVELDVLGVEQRVVPSLGDAVDVVGQLRGQGQGADVGAEKGPVQRGEEHQLRPFLGIDEQLAGGGHRLVLLVHVRELGQLEGGEKPFHAVAERIKKRSGSQL